MKNRTCIWRGSRKSVFAKTYLVVIRNGTYLLGGILHFKTLLWCRISSKKKPWKMTSSCRYPQKLLDYKTCYYVIITSHSVLYPIKMQNLKHENLSFTVILEGWKGQKSALSKKCHYQQKIFFKKGAKRYYQNFMRWIWPIQKVGLAWKEKKAWTAWTKKQRPEKAFGTARDTPRVSQGNK